MLYWLPWLLLIGFPDITLTKTARINQLKRQAESAYRRGDYTTAMVHYRYLRFQLNNTEDAVVLNLAHCYYQLGDTTLARRQYQSLGGSTWPLVQSVRWQQLGVLAYRNGNLDSALVYSRRALQYNPRNDGARYNYELIRKLTARLVSAEVTRPDTVPPEEPPFQLPPPPNQDQPEPPSEEAPGRVDGGMSREQAEMLLKAMEDQESKYLRQRRTNQRGDKKYDGPPW